jgi:transcriptional regulator with XRE-family HTH domain
LLLFPGIRGWLEPMESTSAISDVLAEVGPRLKRVRTQRDVTLVELAAATGISKSTLSRLESGQRKPSLELLLPIAQAHRIPLDELVGAPEIGDPRIRLKPEKRGGGRIVVPLTRQPRGVHAWKVVIPPEKGEPKLRTHEGYEWFYVLAGELRLIIAEHDITMKPGEVAEFDTQVPHWFGPAGDRPVEILSILSRDGERIHVRAQPRRKTAGA